MPLPSEAILKLRAHHIPYISILYGNLPADISADERQMLIFCQEWLNGKQKFTISTSGSTGIPKSVTFSREQMIASAHLTGTALNLQRGDKALVNLNTQYIGGLMMLVRGFVLDLQLTVITPSALPLQTFPDDTHFDFLSFVPMQMQAILEQIPAKKAILNRAKAIILGGAPVSAVLENHLQVLKSPVYHTYGMTETISHIALRRLNGFGRSDHYTVLKGVRIYTDERNCLVIHTPVLPDIPVITNDIVEIISPNTFIWLGRIDHIINSGGVKIQAEKIEKIVENILTQMQIIRRFFVAGLSHAQLGEAIALFIEGEPLSNQQETLLKQQIAVVLSRYENPKSIIYVAVFQETSTGKINQKETIKPFLG